MHGWTTEYKRLSQRQYMTKALDATELLKPSDILYYLERLNQEDWTSYSRT